jgi:hypothetical protein
MGVILSEAKGVMTAHGLLRFAQDDTQHMTQTLP